MVWTTRFATRCRGNWGRMTDTAPFAPHGPTPPALPSITGSALLESRLLLATVREVVAAWLVRG